MWEQLFVFFGPNYIPETDEEKNNIELIFTPYTWLYTVFLILLLWVQSFNNQIFYYLSLKENNAVT